MDYIRFGNGDKALVILPGVSVQSVLGSAELIKEAYKVLTDDYTVYLFDRRQDISEGYSLQDMAKDTDEAIRELGLEHIDLFGVSQGGMIAMQIAVMDPGLVDKLVLGSTCARVTDAKYGFFDRLVSLARDGKTRDLYIAFGEGLFPQDLFNQIKDAFLEPIGTVTEDELERFAVVSECMEGFDFTEELRKIKCPVLVIGDTSDKIFGADSSELIAECLSGNSDCELYMYEGFGHAVYDTAPDYKERILAFLRK